MSRLSLPQRAGIGFIRAYRLLLSPWLGNACRFEPTCSVYAIGAIERHGLAAGGLLTAGRIGRCHPWCAGGHDPVPTRLPRLFAFLSNPAPAAASAAARAAPASHDGPTP